MQIEVYGTEAELDVVGFCKAAHYCTAQGFCCDLHAGWAKEEIFCFQLTTTEFLDPDWMPINQLKWLLLS